MAEKTYTIDVVFLLLVYFMVTASLIRREADVGFMIPVHEGAKVQVPVEVIVEIQPDGAVEMEGMHFARNDLELNALASQISGLKKMALAQGSEFHVNLLPHQDTRHRRVIDVMDACSEAGVDRLGFSKSI